MGKNLFQLILASQSPRRKELLNYLGVNFKTNPSSVEEKTNELDPKKIVEDLAYQKAHDVFNKLNTNENNFVIGSDTIVYMDNTVLGKPKDDEDARRTLKQLSGNEHYVLTGVCFYTQEHVYKFYDETKVKFRELSDEDISIYLNFNEHMDKAGAYGIQGAAQVFVEKIEGNYSNVVGFPLEKMIKKFEDILGKDWRTHFA